MQEPQAEKEDNQRPTILVADDYPTLLRLFSRALEIEGYRVLTASTGATALRLAVKTKPLALVIVQMEVMEEAIEVCRRIRAVSGVPVIIAAAIYEERDMVRSMEAGANDYITKPFGVTEFIARVKAVLRSSSYGST